MLRIFCLFMAVCLCLGACQQKEKAETAAKAERGAEMFITVSSTAFEEGGMIPVKYTYFGPNISPPLSFSGVPEGTRSLVLACESPYTLDGQPGLTSMHWVLFNIPPTTTELPENVPRDETLADGSRQSENFLGFIGYSGPNASSGMHRYFFKLYALDTRIDLSGRVSRPVLMGAMQGHILSEGQLMGKYRRQ